MKTDTSNKQNETQNGGAVRDCLTRLVRHFDPPCLMPPEKMKLWGQESVEQVAFCGAKVGNGKRLIALQPLSTRPTYYLIRVDDGWDLSNWAEGEVLADHLDEVYDAIDDDWGPREWEDDEGNEVIEPWPSLNLDCGCSWWEADPEDYLPNSKMDHEMKGAKNERE